MKTSRIFPVLFIAIIALLASCKKDDLNDLLQKPSVIMHVDTGAVSVIGDPVLPNSGGSNTTSSSSSLQMVDTIGAKFNLSYGLNGECLLRFDNCGHSHHLQQDTVTFSSAALQQNGNYVINPNSVETFTVVTPGSSMIFQVHNLATDTAQITFVTGGFATINQQAPASFYAVPVNGNILLRVRQAVPWLQSATPSPTNPN